MCPKLHLPGGESAAIEKQRPPDVELGTNKAIPSPPGRELVPAENQYPTGTKSLDEPIVLCSTGESEKIQTDFRRNEWPPSLGMRTPPLTS